MSAACFQNVCLCSHFFFLHTKIPLALKYVLCSLRSEVLALKTFVLALKTFLHTHETSTCSQIDSLAQTQRSLSLHSTYCVLPANREAGRVWTNKMTVAVRYLLEHSVGVGSLALYVLYNLKTLDNVTLI